MRTVRKQLAILLVLGLCLSTATAITIRGQEVDFHSIDQEQLEATKEQYNKQHSEDVPGLIKSLAGDERVNLNISTEKGPAVYGFVMDGMKMSRVEKGGIEDPTLIVYTSEETLKAIAEADNPRDRAVQALRDDEIRHETVGFFRSVKYGVMTTLIELFG